MWRWSYFFFSVILWQLILWFYVCVIWVKCVFLLLSGSLFVSDTQQEIQRDCQSKCVQIICSSGTSRWVKPSYTLHGLNHLCLFHQCVNTIFLSYCRWGHGFTRQFRESVPQWPDSTWWSLQREVHHSRRRGPHFQYPQVNIVIPFQQIFTLHNIICERFCLFVISIVSLIQIWTAWSFPGAGIRHQGFLADGLCTVCSHPAFSGWGGGFHPTFYPAAGCPRKTEGSNKGSDCEYRLTLSTVVTESFASCIDQANSNENPEATCTL